MPMFIYISGYFTGKSFLRKGRVRATAERIKSLLIPIVSWVPIVAILEMLFGNAHISAKMIIRIFLTDFWFLWAVIICTFYMYFSEMVPYAYRPIFHFLCALLSLLAPDILWLHAYKFMLPYFAFAFYLSQRKASYMINKGLLWIPIFLLLLFLYSRESYIYLSKFSIWGKFSNGIWIRQLGIDIYRYLIGFAGIASMLCLWKKIWKYVEPFKSFSFIITWLGKNSVAIYILSTYIFVYLVPLLKDSKPVWYFWIVETVSVLAFCSASTILLKKNRHISRVIIGI